IASAAYSRLVDGESIGSGVFARALNHWLLFPSNPVKIADVAYILLVAAIVMYPQLSRLWRALLLPPLLYLVMFVWENLLLVHIGGASRLILLGSLLVGLAPHKITSLGIARTFQTLRLFLNMTVKENVMAAQYGHTKVGVLRSMVRTPGARREEKEIHRRAEEKLAFFGERLMGYRWDQFAYSLSYANRR